MQKNKYFNIKNSLIINNKIHNPDFPIVMGIINLTPDSFYKSSRKINNKEIIDKISQMINEGVEIIDFGALSTRPGSKIISLDEEFERLKNVLPIIKTEFPNLIVSLDTFRPEIADYFLNEKSIDIINDISAGDLSDEKMFDIIKKHNCPYIIMHMRGIPETMQNQTKYNDLIGDIFRYFSSKINKLNQLGISDIIIDPGIGFGKSLEDNYTLLKNLSKFQIFEKPILVGLSRKSLITKILECKPEDALNGTTCLNTIALLNGANILRVHDVKEAKECIEIFKFFNQII